MPAPNTPWAARISAYSPTRPTHTQVPVPHYGLRRSSTPSPNAKIRSTGARPRVCRRAATSIRRRALRATQHRRTRLPSTQAVARHRNPLRQIRPDLPRRRPAGLRRHPRPSGNSEIGRHALVGIPAAPVQLAVRDGVRGALVKDVRLPQALMPEVVLNCDRDDPGQRGHNVEAIQQALARFAAPADQALLPMFRAFDLPRVRRIDRPR